MNPAIEIDKSSDRVRQMFSQIASRYDCMNHLLSMQVDRYWRRKTVRLVPPQGHEPILDVCMGTGDLAFAYHRATGGQIPIVAADFCKPMLDIGEAKKRKQGIGDTIKFMEADAQDLPFEDNHFQIVCVAFGLRNVADTDRGIREMRRVVTPGGKVAVLEFSQPTVQPLKAAYSWYFRHVLPRLGQWLARNDQAAYQYLPESVASFPHGEALAERLRAVELTDVWFRPLTLGIATLYVGTK